MRSTLNEWRPTYDCGQLMQGSSTATSGVNGKLVFRSSFRLGRNDEIRKEYLSTGN